MLEVEVTVGVTLRYSSFFINKFDCVLYNLLVKFIAEELLEDEKTPCKL